MVTVCRTQFQSATSCFKPPFMFCFLKTLFYVQCRAERASSPAPQRESVERSIAARGASLNVWSLSHSFETVEGIIFEDSEARGASGGNTRSAASGAWSLSRRFQGVEGITSAPSKRGWQLSAGHRVNVPAMPEATWSAFFFRAVSPWLGWTS